MFDVGFQEITLIGLIALIVVGPERLPRMARTLGLWAGKIRFYVNQVKSDIDREVRAQELKEMLDKPARELDDLKSVAEETKGTLDRARGALGEAKASFDGAVTGGTSTANEPAAGSIFPTELPGTGPARPEPSETVTAPSAETAPPPSDLPETASVPSAETNPASSDSPETASTLSTETAPPPSDSPPTVSVPSEEMNPITEDRDPTARPEPDAAASGAPGSPSVAMQARESDERPSERH
ncbi:MAG: Sec-independent protein translocase protein TatB [Thiotrichales bacterium]|nr:Sec-independent protein translocase protein TatB [Thiotrichales bacterium]MCY4285259.1 Sec-independent protein translocase protein TatB [Thiotrichales bacterium]MCY4349638.1 Sec-independent protein translocase protein TatB [Thiotrichales bacterium]